MQNITLIQAILDPFSVALMIGLATAGAGGMTSMFNRRAQKKQNIADRKTQLELYDRQRADSLADFNMQNQYNDPKQQMERLKSAGLNPNLVYGSGANTPSATIRSSNIGDSKQTAPQMSSDWLDAIPQSIGSAYNIKQTQAQVDNTQANTDNLKQQQVLMKQEELVKQANIAKTMQDTARSKFELEQARELKDAVITRSQLDNKIKTQMLDLNASKNQREQLANSSNVALTMQKILESKLNQKLQQQALDNNVVDIEKKREEIKQIQAMIEQTKNTTRMQELELKLKRAGIEKGDDIFYRILVQYLNLKLE